MAMEQTKDDAADSTDQPTARFVMDGDGNVAEWDCGAESIFEWSREQAVGTRLSELIIPQRYRAMHEAGLKQFKSTGNGAFIGKPLEILSVDRSGREFPIEISISMETVAGEYRFPTIARRARVR